MRRSARFVWCFLAAALVCSCSEEPARKVVVGGEKQIADEVFTDFVTQESDSGFAQWKLTAPKASRFKEKKTVFLDNPRIDFFDKMGNLKTTLISDAGEYSEESKNMLAIGNVVVRSVDGDVLETDSLVWMYKRDLIVTEAFVTLTRGRDVITGYGLECDPKLDLVDIKRDVKAVIIDDEGNLGE